MERQNNIKIIKQSKVINVSNSCAFDALAFWINLIPTNHAIEMLQLFEPDLRDILLSLIDKYYRYNYKLMLLFFQ